ncbi:hypothetical protein ABZW30_45215 [Kitasatospora sp. NPDC004669]|uniref:hypothetical protein n=1 Tax=Kitasatospora sp. NPDC004669 TaxID=3154555 RepID=UPI0033AD01F0
MDATGPDGATLSSHLVPAADPDAGATTRVTVHVKGAAEQIDDLEAPLRGLGTPGRAPAVKIKIAERALRDGFTGEAWHQLGSFVREVQGERGERLTADQRAQPIADARRIQAVPSHHFPPLKD